MRTALAIACCAVLSSGAGFAAGWWGILFCCVGMFAGAVVVWAAQADLEETRNHRGAM